MPLPHYIYQLIISRICYTPCTRICGPVRVEGGEHPPDDVVGQDGGVRFGGAENQLAHADQKVLLHQDLHFAYFL